MKMISLENKEWKDFKIDSLFSVDKGIYIKQSNIENGKIPYITAKAINNGLNCFIGNNNLFEGNNITVEKVKLSAFYQPSKYYCSHDVSVLSNNKLNKENSLFIATMIGRQGSKYSYGRQAQMNVVKRETLFCPINEKNEPDYEYMENYTKPKIDKKLEDYKKYAKNVLSNLEYKEIEPLENKRWKEFYLSGEKGIFTNYHGKRLIKEHRILGLTPLLTACENNNGISSFISNETMNKYKNCITIDMFGNSFYHNYFCSGDDNIYFFLNDDLCMFKKLFIVEMINKNKNKFSYGKQFRQKNADNFKILLPINEKNDPDFEYMEQYSKNLIYKKINQYLNYKNKEA